MTDAREPQGPDVDLRDADERLAAWVDGELTGKDLERFEAELRVNKRLRDQAEVYRRFVDSTQGALRRPMGSIDIADRVIAAVQSPVAAKHRSLLHPWLLSAAVAAGLVAAVWLMQGTGTPDRRESAVAHDDKPALLDLVDKEQAEREKRVAEADRDAGAAGRLAKEGDARLREGEAKTGGNEIGALHKERFEQQEELRAAKPEAEQPRDDSSRVARKLDVPVPKEEAKKSYSDEFFAGSRRDAEQLAKYKDREKVAAAGGKAAAEGHAEPAQPDLKSAKEPAPATPPPAGDTRQQGFAKTPDAQANWRAGFTVGPDPAVQVMVLTRRGTPEELRRGLTQLEQKDDADKERERQQDLRGSLANQAQSLMLAQQFPSQSLASASASAQTYGSALPGLAKGLQLYSFTVPDLSLSYTRDVLDQARENTGNRAPVADTEQQLRYRQTLKRLVPDGTRANALYVEGEAPRVQEFLQQVSTWAGQNRVEVTFDDVPAAEVDKLKQTQLSSQLGQVQGQGGGGPATQGPAGPATPGPVTGGSKSQSARNVPAPAEPQPEPARAPVRAVLLLFREQALSENKR